MSIGSKRALKAVSTTIFLASVFLSATVLLGTGCESEEDLVGPSEICDTCDTSEICDTCDTSEICDTCDTSEICDTCDIPADTCKQLVPECACSDDRDEAIFQVLRPDGGEVFVIDERETLYVCIEPDNDWYPEEDYAYGLEQATEWLSVDGGKSWGTLSFSSLRRNEEMNQYYWDVPDSIDIDVDGELQTVSTVSDSCLFRIEIYSADGDPAVNYDVSDDFFSIVPSSME